MKKLLLILSIICFVSACQYKSGSGNIITQTRNLGDFAGVNVGGGFEVEIKIGSNRKVVVEADDNVIDDIETSIDNGQLKISLRNGMSYNNVHMKVFVTAPEINKINSSASADVEVKDELSSENKIVLNASSGSSIKATLNAPEANADASSGAEINLEGRTKNFDAQASSGASVKASDLLSENTIAESSSGGTVEVHASVKLNAKANSGGTVSYRGAANVVSNENSGGSINKKD
ncbi:MAG TPA: head GIN domain-containing protein [Ferruginibacter sp.]|nr:head GIN domain-containing protein [Ferruginibacter sp.]